MRINFTTLSQEVTFYKELIKYRLTHYEIKRNYPLSEKILQIFLSHSKKIEISPEKKREILEMIEKETRKENPITVGISFALGARIPNSLKFKEIIPFPTLGWMHFGYFFTLLNEKIKKVYPPGIQVFVFEESSAFPEFFNPTETKIMIAASKKIFEMLNSPIEIIPLKKEYFPEEEVEKINVNVGEDQIFGILCSLPEMVNMEVMETLYLNKKERNYQKIKKMVPDLWEKAKNFCVKMNKYWTFRKEKKLFEKLIGKKFLDCCATQKKDRIVFDITSNCLLNHGMPVVQRNFNGFYKIYIIPEYRIYSLYGEKEVKKILIEKNEFVDVDAGYYTFYYLIII